MAQGRANIWALLVVVFLHQFLGFLWYAPQTLGVRWAQALGKDEAFLNTAAPVVFVMAIVAAFFLSYVLALLIRMAHIQTVGGGIKMGLLVWMGFVLPTLVVHYMFAQFTLELLWIDALKELVGLLISGAILAVWR
jgi:hypothetical protein